MLKKKNNQPYLTSESWAVELVENSQVFPNEDLNQLYDAIKRLSEVDRCVILLYLERNSGNHRREHQQHWGKHQANQCPLPAQDIFKAFRWS